MEALLALAKLLIHVVIGAICFSGIVLVALALAALSKWTAGFHLFGSLISQGIDAFEALLFAADFLLAVVFLVKIGWDFIKELKW